jgi:hypothetical protein
MFADRKVSLPIVGHAKCQFSIAPTLATSSSLYGYPARFSATLTLGDYRKLSDSMIVTAIEDVVPSSHAPGKRNAHKRRRDVVHDHDPTLVIDALEM